MNASPRRKNERLHFASAAALAAVMSVSSFGQTLTPDQIRQIQQENEALRKRVADLEGRASPPPPSSQAAPPAAATAVPGAPLAPRTTTAAPRPGSATTPAAVPTTTSVTGASGSSGPNGNGVVTLSPFEVQSERDYGYLRTNSATATRIGTEIQLVPLSITVLSEDFLRDTNTRDIQDVLRYTSSSAGDTRMGVLQPATGATPSGNMSLRGFPINSRLRNGVLRYNLYNLDNVERVEVIKGPAAVFFGQAFPGGRDQLYHEASPVFGYPHRRHL